MAESGTVNQATSTKLGTSISSEANTQNTKHCGLVAVELGLDRNNTFKTQFWCGLSIVNELKPPSLGHTMMQYAEKCSKNKHAKLIMADSPKY